MAPEPANSGIGSENTTDDRRADVAGLFESAGERGLRRTLDDLLVRRLDTAECLDRSADPIWPVWREALIGPVRRYVDDPTVQADMACLLDLRASGQIEQAEQAGDAQAPLLRELLASWERVGRRGPMTTGTGWQQS